MDKETTIRLVRDFLSLTVREYTWFTDIEPFIKATLLYGSRAKETNRPDSDIDILIILPLEKEEAYTVGEYFYTYNGFEINIVLRSIEKLRSIAKEKSDTLQKEVFRNAVVIHDSDGEVTKLLEEIKKIGTN